MQSSAWPGSLLREAAAQLAAIQAPVKNQLGEVLSELRRVVVSEFADVQGVNDHLLLMRGKLLRPTLLLLASRVGDEADEDAVTLAAVVELVHLATLVHDDAVDHSVLRRGLPTVNAVWTHQVAIIMGDYLYSRAVTELARLNRLESLRSLAQAANEMSVGEMRQLTSFDALDFSEADYYALIRAKTASLMRAACEMGALAGVERYRAQLAHYGENLGMAFQIADDLLDYTGTEAVTGKPTGHDLREHKVTLPLVEAMRHVSPEELETIRALFDEVDPSDEAILGVVDIVQRRGGLDYARERARGFAAEALSALDGLAPGPALDALRDAVGYAVDRSL